ncbi:Rne/Rng family ribonuclease [Pseudochrobactrum sp. sp1633]|uniref:Rne/Rng family ribonuclease n=1 Tax=Pseudochrobactrum sp. sp1633 TaxID=3036706 RepID=UPI0025A681F5|nr:ribonuclease E/G [Pseudochrobactrum sp. sp1633]MDM8344012.1 Rne/Rng family ribonuclease [Pseudochrobactrum sp. sp1633]HWD11986.1 Rne/Rng family ribonuclease [Pseudochrobactrum sp.]
MSNKMLIDASHPEETRVVVVRGNKIEEFDFESEHKKQLKGNVYLARVTRVEPSLQAAFVEYGGNRHGFLAFSEIHPDYYQIPEADRKALIEAEARAARDEDDEEREEAPRRNRRGHNERRGSGRNRHQQHNKDVVSAPALPAPEFVGDFAVEAQENYAQALLAAAQQSANDDTDDNTSVMAASSDQPVIREKASRKHNSRSSSNDDEDDDDHDDEDDQVESVGAEDAMEELPGSNRAHRKHYKIQDVIKRRQIVLVQVVKEERGNKGAALTTYLSLAGRYSVLMPNTARGGGISRKITNIQDRKRLKDIVKELEVPQGMGVILRTAGANRTKAEVRRDYEYLMRMWDNVRQLTMQSQAPALVYEEGNLIKRSIRDLYNKDITDILVAGETGYREAKDFMRMLMPTHARVVQPYRETTPIFARNGIEAQLDRMLHPQVTLKSGGYIIINQTEALVAVDVNSGRSTRESSIEETALQTNLEAAEEVARQLRLRDLAGLVVVDFIDMEEKRNNRAVEKRMKDCLKDDRARIQVGRISHFGLLEMSRQRIRASVLESTMQPCPHCAGTGLIRSDSSMGLFVIRSIEEFLQRNSQNNIIVRAPQATALYVLNHKRHLLAEMESRFGLTIELQIDETVGHQHLAIDKGAPAAGPVNPVPQTIQFMPYDEENDPEIIDVEDETEAEAVSSEDEGAREETGDDRKRGRRRRRRRGGRDRDASEAQGENASDEDEGDDAETDDASAQSEEDRRKKRRRGRRGGRKNRRGEYDNDNRMPAVEFVGFSRDEAITRLNAYQAAAKKASAPLPAPEFVGFQPQSAKAVAVAQEASVKAETPAQTSEKADKKTAKPARKRAAKPRTAKAAADVVTEVPAEEAEAPVATEEPAAVEAPAKTTRKKAADKAEKPARKPRGKKAAEPAEASDNVIAEAPVEVAAVAPVSKQEASPQASSEPAVESAPEPQAEKPARNRRSTQEASKPVVTSQVGQAEKKEEPAEQPKRGGWWQKKGFF